MTWWLWLIVVLLAIGTAAGLAAWLVVRYLDKQINGGFK